MSKIKVAVLFSSPVSNIRITSREVRQHNKQINHRRREIEHLLKMPKGLLKRISIASTKRTEDNFFLKYIREGGATNE